MDKYLMMYQVKTPMHMGSGTELGVVDMPIQRERVTSFPKMEASGIKGSLRAVYKKGYNIEDKTNNKYLEDIFGPEDDGSEYASAIKVSDGRILFFPVRSAKGIYALVTCPYVIDRFKEDFKLRYSSTNTLYRLIDGLNISNIENKKAKVFNKSKILVEKNEVIIDEYKYSCNVDEKLDESLKKLAIELFKTDKNFQKSRLEKVIQRILIVSDEDFKFFTTMGTEINTRIRIGDNGVVDKDKGALFTEEYLPVESILYGFVELEDIKSLNQKEVVKLDYTKKNVIDEYKKFFDDMNFVQFGGNSTLGKGWTKIYSIGE